MRERAARTGKTPWHSGGIYDEDSRQPMERQPEPQADDGYGSGAVGGGGPGSPMSRAPWEARGAEVFVERGKAAPKARRHKVPPEAGRLLKNDHLGSDLHSNR